MFHVIEFVQVYKFYTAYTSNKVERVLSGFFLQVA